MSVSGKIRGECHDCKHQWIVIHLPMALSRVIDILAGAHCPMCGAGNESIFVHEPEEELV